MRSERVADGAQLPVTRFSRSQTGPSRLSQTTKPPVPRTGAGSSRGLGSGRGFRGGRSRIDENWTVDVDDDGENGFPAMPHVRSMSEPPARMQFSLLKAIDVVDAGLPFDSPTSPRQASRRREHAKDNTQSCASSMVNLACAVVCLVSGWLIPVLVDLSRTATARRADGTEVQRLPYDALSVLRSEAVFNVALGLLVMWWKATPGGFAALANWDLHMKMLPLTLVYSFGDLAALFSIGSGGGPLYVVVANSRLIFAALCSRVIIGHRQSLFQWALLTEISLAAAAYAVLSTREAWTHGEIGVFSSVCWALLKSALSGTAAVLTESRYKRLDLWQANTLLKSQSLLLALLIGRLLTDTEDLPLCSDDRAASAPMCIDRRGWDGWTWAVLAGEIFAGWLNVAVLKRMSAVAKFVCKTATVPALYLGYCAAMPEFQFEAARFVAVVFIAGGILAYTVHPYVEVLRSTTRDIWAGHYALPSLRPR